MSHLFILCCICCLMVTSASGQLVWTGGGAAEIWSDPANWSGLRVPGADDDVLLDHVAVNGPYRVSLPDLPVSVRTIRIVPGSGDSIELLIPSSNTFSPALVVSGSGYGIDIGARAVFRNASGLSSGVSLQVADSIRVADGGRFVHQTAGTHAGNVLQLSAAPGTEHGIFEFNIPDASSTLSLSGRRFGSLVLNAAAAGGSLNYTAAGTNPVLIRSNLEVNEGVRFNLNFSDTLHVKGDVEQHGGVIDLGTTARSVVLAIAGNVYTAPGAVMMKSGAGLPAIVLDGYGTQELRFEGRLSPGIGLVMKKTGEAVLRSSLLLSHRLEMISGVLRTTAAAQLQLDAACELAADSLSMAAYIDGPVKKLGLRNGRCLFPVGGQGMMRWLSLEEASGDFTVMYMRADPHAVSASTGNGIDHVSRLEYWRVQADDPASAAVLRLSFVYPHSGTVTDLPALRVARLTAGRWENAGNTGFQGSAGSNGWVGSFPAGGFSAEGELFALASAIGQENPLPFIDFNLQLSAADHGFRLDWQLLTDLGIDHFNIMQSADGLRFDLLGEQPYRAGSTDYAYFIGGHQSSNTLYRIDVVNTNGEIVFRSKLAKVASGIDTRLSLRTTGVTAGQLPLFVSAPRQLMLTLVVIDVRGVIIKRIQKTVSPGQSVWSVDLENVAPGLYFIRSLVEGGDVLPVMKFIRR